MVLFFVMARILVPESEEICLLEPSQVVLH